MISRRLLSSLAGSCVVAALMGCNAIVGNEDVEYTETATTKPPKDGAADVEPDPETSTDGSFVIEDAEAGPGDDEDIEDGGAAD